MVSIKEFVSLTTVAMKLSKRHDQWKMLQEEKYFLKNMHLTDANYHWKFLWVDLILDTSWDKTLQPQKYTFWEKEPKKLRKHNNFTFHDYLEQYCL